MKPDTTMVSSVIPLLPVSRAVVRAVEPGNDAICEYCQAPVKFAARSQQRQVIANVYVDARWDRVEHYHEDCYEAAGEPYGVARS